jgi:DNA-binding Lrp family transcriptional regulator
VPDTGPGDGDEAADAGRTSSARVDDDPAEGRGAESAPAVDTSRAGPHDRATVTAADRATADRLAALEATDAVARYVPLVDYDALGLRTAVLRVDARHGNARSVADDLRDGPGVAVYRTSDRFDVIAVCRFPSVVALRRSASRLASDPRVRAHRVALTRRVVADRGPLDAVADAD